MTLRDRLAALSAVIAEEAERNGAFRRRLEEAFGPRQSERPTLRDDKVRDHRPGDSRATADASRKGGRRTPAVLDPIALARQSEEALRRELSVLNLDQLKDVVAQYGMDPGKLVMKWKDSGRIIDRIVELSMARSTKGDAFRADKVPVPNPAPDEDVDQPPREGHQ
jgi:hypothetical protein